MAKTKIMNFQDGPKEVHVGMKCFSTNGQSGQYHKREHHYEVESIGNKLVTMKGGDKFYLETGRKQTEYSWGILYSSKEAYQEECRRSQVIEKVCDAFDFRQRHKITYDQAIKIAEILGLKFEN